MDITRFSAMLATATVAVAAIVDVVEGAPIASADDVAIHDLGDQAQLVNGSVVQGWTISDLHESTDTVPYPVQGTLWEAAASDEALQGSVIPIVSDLNARARSGQTYRALFLVATPQGVDPAPLGQGQTTSGKVYFDVTGDDPDSVVYNAGGADLLVWLQRTSPVPDPATQTLRSAGSSSTHPAPSTDMAPASAQADAVPGPVGTKTPPASSDSQGTPLGSQATPPTPPTATATVAAMAP